MLLVQFLLITSIKLTMFIFSVKEKIKKSENNFFAPTGRTDKFSVLNSGKGSTIQWLFLQLKCHNIKNAAIMWLMHISCCTSKLFPLIKLVYDSLMGTQCLTLSYLLSWQDLSTVNINLKITMTYQLFQERGEVLITLHCFQTSWFNEPFPHVCSQIFTSSTFRCCLNRTVRRGTREHLTPLLLRPGTKGKPLGML